MKKKNIIGILAGMGPKSTGPFIDQVISQYQEMTGAIHDIDFPPILIYSLPTPFYIDRPIDHSLMEKTICEGLQKLESCGTSFVAIPCNTAHLYFDALQNCIQIPLLNMVNLALESIPQSAKKIAIVGTRPTLESQLYQNGLLLKGFEPAMHPLWQKKIDEMIAEIKGANRQETLLKLWRSLSSDFHAERIDAILLVCTDLNVFFKGISPRFQIVDASLILAKAIVVHWLANKNPA